MKSRILFTGDHIGSFKFELSSSLYGPSATGARSLTEFSLGIHLEELCFYVGTRHVQA